MEAVAEKPKSQQEGVKTGLAHCLSFRRNRSENDFARHRSPRFT